MGKLLDIDTYETYMDQQNELIGVIAENSSTKLKSKITTPATGDIGQVLSVNSVDSDGKPKTWIASDIDDILEYSDVVSGKVDKVTGKSLSTNDYDNSAKSKVDSIPSIVATKDSEVTTSTKLHFKQTNGYTDFAEMSDLESLSDDLANYNNTKVGYSEVENGQLKMYSDSTKAHLLATLDLPSGDVTASENNVFTGVNKFQNGSASGCMVFGAEVNSNKNRAGYRKLARLSYPTPVADLNCTFVSCDTQGSYPQLGISGDYNSVEFGGRDGDVTNTSPDVLTFTVVKEHNSVSYGKKVAMMAIDKDNIAMEVIPTVNGKTIAKAELTDDTLPAWTVSEQSKALARLGIPNEWTKIQKIITEADVVDGEPTYVEFNIPSGATEFIYSFAMTRTDTSVASFNLNLSNASAWAARHLWNIGNISSANISFRGHSEIVGDYIFTDTVRYQGGFVKYDGDNVIPNSVSAIYVPRTLGYGNKLFIHCDKGIGVSSELTLWYR